MRPMPAPLGLYIHIPFCKSKCVYCDFYSLPRSESRMDDYTDALCAHLAETAPFAAGHLVDTVYFGGVRYAYTKDLEGYIRGVRDHAPMLSESDRIPPLDRDTEWVMLGLRTTAGLDPKAFERRFRRRFTCFLPFLDQCARAGYAVAEDGRWHLTPRGFLVSNQIIGGMLDALAADKQRRADAAARGDFRVNLD